MNNTNNKKVLHFILMVATVFLPITTVVAATTIGNNVSVGGTLTTTGASTLTGGFISNASSSIGGNFQVAGNQAVGTIPTGNAQLFVQASTTTAVPFSVVDSGGNNIFQSASSSINAASGQIYGTAAALLGSSAGLTGAMELKNNGTQSPFISLDLDSSGHIATFIKPGSIDMANAVATTTINRNSLQLGITSSNATGVFSVDSSGNVSASGTLRVNQGANTTTTVNIGSLGLSTSKTCINLQNAVGSQASIYVSAANTLVVEGNACK